MPTKKKYTYKQKTSKKKQYNKKKRTIKKRHTRKKTRYGGKFFGSLWDSRPNLPKVSRPKPPALYTVAYKGLELPLYKRNQIKLLEILKNNLNNFEKELKNMNKNGDILTTEKTEKNGVMVKHDVRGVHPSKHKGFMLEATQINQKAWEHADETLRKDRDLTLKAIEKNPRVLEYIDEEFKNDKDFVISAVKKRGTDLQYAINKMRDHKEVVTAAVKNDGYAIKFASVDLIKNDEFIVKLLKLYWDGEIKYPGRVDFSLDDNKHPKYKKNRDDNFDLFFIEIDNILEDEKKIKLITRAQEEIKQEAGRNVFNHNVMNPLHPLVS